MKTELPGIIVQFLLALFLSIPLGKYISQVFRGAPTWPDRLLNPLDRFIYKWAGIRSHESMNWKQHLVAMITINGLWIFLCMLVLMLQAFLPLNPDHNPGMSADLAFNTAISFVVNCDLQHYSGESGLSYLSQLFLLFLQFVSAATGIAAAAVLFEALKERTSTALGNFWYYFVRSVTRLLLPLSIVVAVLLMTQGVPMTFSGKAEQLSLQGDTMQISRGPVAAFVAIKHLGTNGGGFFGANSAHPLENPTYLSNIIEMVAQLLIPMALVFALGYYLNRKKLAFMLFGIMTVGFLMLVIPAVVAEMQGNPAIQEMGISRAGGAMEGKEVRFGAAASGFWSIATTVISTGSVNAMHDSGMPVSGMSQLLAMFVNAFYGGCGVGLLNMFIYVLLAVFISGLMVGRTPEFLGKKVEAREIKIAMIIALLHPLLILSGTAVSCYLFMHNQAGSAAWLNNPGYHGFSEMLYEFTSAAANNGSGFEGLGDNNPWWNISTGMVLLLGRFLPIIGPLAIAGLLAGKKYIPEGAGTLKTDSVTFGIMVFAVLFIITALSFFPALALGPIAEHAALH